MFGSEFRDENMDRKTIEFKSLLKKHGISANDVETLVCKYLVWHLY